MKPQDIEDLKELIEFLKHYQVAEFDLDRGDIKIRLKFSPPETPAAGLSDLARLLAIEDHVPGASLALLRRTSCRLAGRQLQHSLNGTL